MNNLIKNTSATQFLLQNRRDYSYRAQEVCPYRITPSCVIQRKQWLEAMVRKVVAKCQSSMTHIHNCTLLLVSMRWSAVFCGRVVTSILVLNAQLSF